MTPTVHMVARSRSVQAVVALWAMVALLVGGAPAASAHTELLTGAPGPTQVVGGTVDFVDLVFAEPVEEVSISVTVPDGVVVDGQMDVANGQIIRFDMAALEMPGRYVVRYRMISADGDDTASGFLFTYEPDAFQPQRLGEVDVPRDTVGQIRQALIWVVGFCLVGVIVILFVRLSRNRAALQRVQSGR